MEIIEPAKTEEIVNKFGDVRIKRTPALAICCGVLLQLSHFTNTCDECGSDYDTNGSRLAPREQWGEETGEHYSDILSV